MLTVVAAPSRSTTAPSQHPLTACRPSSHHQLAARRRRRELRWSSQHWLAARRHCRNTMATAQHRRSSQGVAPWKQPAPVASVRFGRPSQQRWCSVVAAPPPNDIPPLAALQGARGTRTTLAALAHRLKELVEAVHGGRDSHGTEKGRWGEDELTRRNEKMSCWKSSWKDKKRKGWSGGHVSGPHWTRVACTRRLREGASYRQTAAKMSPVQVFLDKTYFINCSNQRFYMNYSGVIRFPNHT